MPIKRFTCGVIACFLGGIAAASPSPPPHTEPEPLRYIEFGGFPPFAYQTDKGVEGSLPEFVRFLFEPLGYEVITKHVIQARILPEVLAGRGDIMIAYSYPGFELENYPDSLRICKTPIYVEPYAFFSLSDKALSIKSIEDVENLTVGSLQILKFRRGLDKFKVQQVFRFVDTEKMFQGLMAGRIDVALSGNFIMSYFARKNHMLPPHASPYKFGELKAFIALPAAADSRLQLFDTACGRVQSVQAADTLLKMSYRHEDKLFENDPDAEKTYSVDGL